MPKKVKEMSATEVRNLKSKGFYAVGGVSGLYLSVQSETAKSWVLRTTVGKKRRDIGLGGYPDVTLAQAREKAREIKAEIKKGTDPIVEKKKLKDIIIQNQSKHVLFEEAAKICHKKKSQEFSNDKHANDWISSINRYAIPIIGKIPVDKIELAHIIKILEPIWAEKTETATRLRQRIEFIMTWATVSGFRKGENPARWKNHLDAILPQPSKIKRTNHYPALPWKEIGLFMKELKKREGMSPKCLEFLILTIARSSQARLATTGEFNFAEKLWNIPGIRMKNRKPHSVPLSKQAIKIVKEVPKIYESKFIFTGRKGKQLSDMTLSELLRRMGVNAVPHGFRSTFRDWASEATYHSSEVIEMAMAHAIKNKTEEAYRRGKLIEKRRKLMDEWAEFCYSEIN